MSPGGFAEAGLCGLSAVPMSIHAGQMAGEDTGTWRCRMWPVRSLSPRFNQTLRASSHLYVTGSRLSPPIPALSQHCISDSLHLCCRSTALTRSFELPVGKELSRQSCQPQILLSNRAGRKGSLFSFSETHLPNQGHPAGLVLFPERPTESLVLMADLCVSSF